MARSGTLTRRLVAWVSILAPTLLLASMFPPRLMFEATTAAGGDLGSHNYAAAMAREMLLTRHQLTGWVPGNFCGFPLFQMYFPLPFVLIVAASLIVDPHVAFKLTSVAGVLALPASAYFCVAGLRAPFPGPAIAASFMLPFLLQTGNSAWGGNLQSTLAGEFAFSISLPLALVYVGFHHKAYESVRGSITCAAIVALLALTHAYTVLWVALASALALIAHERLGFAVRRLVCVYAAAGALCAFWLVPLLWYSPWTTAFKHLWVIQSIRDVFPPPLWPVLVLAVAAPLYITCTSRETGRNYWRPSALLYAAAVASAVEYFAAPNFGVVDVRFLPFLQLSLCLLAATGCGYVLSRWPARALWIPIAFAGMTLVTLAQAGAAAGWIRWNYEGFEHKAMWPVYRAIADRLRGTAADPRVVYEHSPDNESLGSVRAFENLPLFSGRSTLEGVNFQASVTSPFVFYIQSEISEVMSCPFAEWGCSRSDLAAGIGHLKMMHVSDLIVRSATMKSAAAREPELAHLATAGPYEIYRLSAGRGGYALPLALAPYAVVTSDWKSDAYRWFKRARMADPVPVFVDDPDSAGGHPFAAVYSGLPKAAPQRALAGVAPLTEIVESERIRIRGCVPGQPVLVRISFHPRWRSTTGERVWLAGPGFMLVFPGQSDLELVYGERLPTVAGRALTIATALGMIVLAAGVRVGRRPSRSEPGKTVPDGRSATRTRSAAAAFCVLCGLAAIGAGVRARSLNADRVYLRGVEQLDRGNMEDARRLFQQARELAPLSNTAIHSTYFSAMSLYRERRWIDARRGFRELIDRFPEAQAAAESMYHIGLCAEQLQDAAGAERAFNDTRSRFPASPWARYSEERLSALKGSR